MEIGLDTSAHGDKTAVCIRTPSRTPEIAAMVAALEAEGVEVVVVEGEPTKGEIAPDDMTLLKDIRAILLSPDIPPRFVDQHRNRPFNSHPRSFRKK